MMASEHSHVRFRVDRPIHALTANSSLRPHGWAIVDSSGGYPCKVKIRGSPWPKFARRTMRLKRLSFCLACTWRQSLSWSGAMD